MPCITETVFGIDLLPRARENMGEWAKLLPVFYIYTSDVQDAEDAAELQISLRRQGWQLETIDATIAIIAVRNKLTLLTTDQDFAAVPNLTVENWLA